MPRRWLILIGLLAVIGAAFAFFVLRPTSREHPITDLRGHVLYTHVDRVYPSPPEYWVFLPKEESSIPEPAPKPLTTPAKPLNAGYLGTQACADCHRDKYNSFIQTSHFLTSRTPTREAIRGSFDPGKNILTTSRSRLRFEMDARQNGFFQTAIVDQGRNTYSHTERFDIITGSGNHGQSYLYWRGDRLYQLPVSYFAQLKGWVNSPGYTEGTANFSRAIRSRCLECHSTYFEHDPDTMNRYRHDNFLLGISCERCHGPGAKHVNHHRSHPDDKQPHAIVNPAELPVERRHDVCRQCHSRSGQSLKPAFTFRPGEKLSEYIDLSLDAEDAPGQTGVHTANQFARLRTSKCFKKSPEMSCIDCHNPHRNERENLAVFSERCQKCHPVKDCKVAAAYPEKLARNCIDCHMPSKFDALIVIETATATEKNPMRDHFISIDKPLSQRLLKTLLSSP